MLKEEEWEGWRKKEGKEEERNGRKKVLPKGGKEKNIYIKQTKGDCPLTKD